MPDAEPTTEVWTYGGDILTTDGKLGRLWLDPEGKRLIYPKRVTGHRPGDLYEARVVRDGDGISVIGTPKWVNRRNPDAELRATLVAQSEVAKLTHTRRRMEKTGMHDLDRALEPLQQYFASLVTMNDRRALIAYAIDKLYRM